MLESLENNLIEVKNASSELTLHGFERRKECLEILSKKLLENSEKIININTKEIEKSSSKGNNRKDTIPSNHIRKHLAVSILKDTQGHHCLGEKHHIPQSHRGNFRGCLVWNVIH